MRSNTRPGVHILSGMSQSKMRPEFYRLHAATLRRATTAADLAALLRAADAMPERHRLAEGAVYVAAQRRWLMLTGTDWKGMQRQTGDTTWTDSAHRLRIDTDPADGCTRWRCSCGHHGYVPAGDTQAAMRAHDTHRTEALSACT
jgi:hypothetical protein